MLAAIGVDSFDELIQDVPAHIRAHSSPTLPPALSEHQVEKLITGWSDRSSTDVISFAGAGMYEHLIPAAVDAILTRSEFYTSYTPYQAEVSQGTLQAIYEFQTMVCELFGCDVANASMYDGPAALAEAVLLALGLSERNQVVFAGQMHPLSLAVTSTYLSGTDVEMIGPICHGGVADLGVVAGVVGDDTAAVVVGQPNFYGHIEDVSKVMEIAHSCGAVGVVVANPVAMALLEPPGRQGADIIVGEGQCLGNSMSFGGPALGLFGSRDKLKRRLPGRIVGRTVDNRGQDAYVLTLQTREQHIRREKATSNICTNQNLNALAATVYMTLLGPEGFGLVAETSVQHAHWAAEQISALDGYSLAFDAPFFHEFVVRCSRPAREIVDYCGREKWVVPGVDLGRFDTEMENTLLVAVTEARTREDIDALTDALDEASRG